MKRYVDMKDISDGRLYGLNDMVKADCADCTGCSACCRGMGTSIVLDPYDIWRLTEGLGVSAEQLLAAGKIELNVVDGIILPNLKMQEGSETCGFLSVEGRCSVHPYRPGICRLFPLGRYYEDGSFQYFLQIHECRNQNRSKVKVWKWIDTPDARRYDRYITDWHAYITELQEQVAKLSGTGTAGETQIRQLNVSLLNIFFLRLYDAEKDFYTQFYERIQMMKGEEMA